jgi:hypothetical protein
MLISLPRPWGMSIEQLLELERSFRVMAAKTKDRKAANSFLALAERYRALVTERQICEQKEHPFC